MIFSNTEKILLIGDSITDCGRREDPDELGDGYVRVIADYCNVHYPESKLQIVNRGIGGDRVIELLERWERDVINEQPDWVSISIGINDVWRQIDHLDRPVEIEEFTTTYDQLVKQTKQQTKAKLILLETTVIDEDLSSVGNQLLGRYNEFIRQLAAKHEAVLVPMNLAFKEYLQKPSRAKLTTDGVHMNSTGNLLMATTWLKECGLYTG
jgi:acyl-CoA thioesterase-1